MIERLLLDNSAWVRLNDPALPEARREEIASALETGALFTSLPFVLEAGYSARNARDHSALIDELISLPWATIDDAVEKFAMGAQRELARAGHHRMPPVDVLTAALAHRHELGVLHYDRDYDVVAEKTSLNFASTWLARRGTLA